jgi:hypothetical protein
MIDRGMAGIVPHYPAIRGGSARPSLSSMNNRGPSKGPSSRFAAAACALLLLAGCDGPAQSSSGLADPSNLQVQVPGGEVVVPASGLSTQSPSEGSENIDHPLTTEERECGLGPSDQVDVGGQKITLLSPKRSDAETVANCLIRRGLYGVVHQYVLLLLVDDGYQSAYRVNSKLASSMIAQYGLTLETRAADFAQLPFIPNLDSVARSFGVIREHRMGIVGEEEARKWQSVLKDQESKKIKASRSLMKDL